MFKKRYLYKKAQEVSEVYTWVVWIILAILVGLALFGVFIFAKRVLNG